MAAGQQTQRWLEYRVWCMRAVGAEIIGQLGYQEL